MRALGVLLIVLLQPIAIRTQVPAPERPPVAATDLVVGSEHLVSLTVASLERALAFYRDGVGLQAEGTSNGDSNAPLRQLFGLPDAHLRWAVAGPPAMTAGIEIMEISGTPARRLGRRVQEPGAFMLLVTVRDVDAVMQRMKAVGGTVVTTGGGPVTAGRANPLRAVVLRDTDGHFIELLQPGTLPDGPASGAIDVRLRLTVDDLDQAVALYRDALGFHQVSISGFITDRTGMDLLGLPPGGEYRYASLQVPGTKLSIELIEFRGVERQRVDGRIQDPGSTRLQLQVRDLDAAVRAVVHSGGAVVSTGAVPLELPVGGNATVRGAMVRDPDNMFLAFFAR